MPDGLHSGVADDVSRLKEELRKEKAARIALENAHGALQAAFAQLEGGVLVLDSDHVLFANPAISEAFDIPGDRLHRLTREQFIRELKRSSNEPPDFLDRIRERSQSAAEFRG